MAYVEPRLPAPGSFESCFERDGEDWLYRRNPHAAAIRVTGAERKVLMDAHARWLDRALMVAMVGGMAVMVLPLLFWNQTTLPWLWWAGGIAALAACVVAYRWRFIAQATARFADRSPAAPPRSRREVSRLRLARTSWRQVGVNLLVPLLWVGMYAWRIQTSRFAIVFVVLFGLAFIDWAVTAVRKLRLERGSRA